jgi:hemerythrin-like domain-containing protein
MDSFELLEKEHKLIKRAVKAIIKQRDRVQQEELVSESSFWGIIDFMSTYSDIVHHGKEERILFRYLEKLDVSPELAKTISELVEEHTKLLTFVAGMRRAAKDFFRGVPAARLRVVNYLTAYTELIEPHVQQEDTKLFPALRTLLDKAALKHLAEEFNAFDAKMMPKVHETYEELVKALEE